MYLIHEEKKKHIRKEVIMNRTSINLGTTNPQRIALSLKVRCCDVISPMHCLTNLKVVAEL